MSPPTPTHGRQPPGRVESGLLDDRSAPTPEVAAPDGVTGQAGARSDGLPASRRPGVVPAVSPRTGPVDDDLRRPAPAARHRPPRPLVLLVLLLVACGVGYWLYTARPWVSTASGLAASGTLEADEVLIGAEVAGRLIGLAREGDAVQAGQIVAQLDDSLLRLQIRQVDAATQQQLLIQADRFQLRAPITGVVTRVPMHTGEVVAPGQVVLAVADLSSLEMTAYVLERDLGRVRVGQEVAVTADPFPGRAFRGVVTSTNQRAEFTPRNIQTQRDRLNLVFGVKIRVENPRGELKPGMPADAHFDAP